MGKESHFVLERKKGRKSTGLNLKVKNKVTEGLWQSNPEKRVLCMVRTG